MSRRIWTDQELIKACESSITYSEILIRLGMVPVGGNYNTIKKYIKKLNIDVSHLLGKGKLRSKVISVYKVNLREILIENCDRYVRTSDLKKRLIEDGFLRNECYICGLTKWMNKEIVLHIDHINGNNKDHRLENLRILCPNCHSQTDTYCGKNIKKYSHIKNPKKEKFCIDCNKNISSKAVRCHTCELERRIKEGFLINWPSDEDFLNLVLNNGVCGTARLLNCSYNSVRKHKNKVKKKMLS